jgi:hypothetical protein
MSLTLRNAFGHFATGVTIITMTDPGGHRIGMTAKASRRCRWTRRSAGAGVHLGQPPAFCGTRHFAARARFEANRARVAATKDIDRFGVCHQAACTVFRFA